MAYIKHKQPTAAREDLGKKMEHQMKVIVDSMEDSCTYVMIKHKKLDTEMGFAMSLILEMICACEDVTFTTMCHPIITKFIIIIIG